MRFDVNLSTLFVDLPLLKRPFAAAAAGFDTIEMWWPFPDSVPQPSQVDRLIDSIQEAGLRVVLLNQTDGDIPGGQHGLLALPEERSQFRDHLDVVIDMATRLACPLINALYGNIDLARDRSVFDDTALENLVLGAERARGIGATLVLEALNPLEFPAYGLHRTDQSLALADRVREVSGEEVKLLFDIYHVQRSEGDIIARISTHAARVGHVQIADPPGRHRPGTGELAFQRVLPVLDAVGYAGYVGLEYWPSRDPEDTFAWLPRECRSSLPTIGRP